MGCLAFRDYISLNWLDGGGCALKRFSKTILVLQSMQSNMIERLVLARANIVRFLKIIPCRIIVLNFKRARLETEKSFRRTF